jgi:mannan endo-1,4-beta-mannosidase
MGIVFHGNKMKKRLVGLLLIFLFVFSFSVYAVPPVNKDASKEAKKLLEFLTEIEGKYMLTAQQNFISSGNKYSEIIKAVTGKYPLIFGSDFSFAYKGNEPQKYQHPGPINLTNPPEPLYYVNVTPGEARQNMIENAIKQYRQGCIITLMWHGGFPGSGDVCDGDNVWTWDKHPNQQQWDELTTDGTPLNKAWKDHADIIAGYLKQLRDSGVPVLWRPYHEMNGIWFWWCNKKGDDGFKKLWVMMYNYYTKHHQLNNLLWVWDTNAPRAKINDEAYPYTDFWPGTEYVDILAADVYHRDWKQSHHDDLKKLANGKPIALGEVGEPPTSQILDQQPDWVWFMPWPQSIFWEANSTLLRQIYADKRVLTKENVFIDENGTYKIKTLP